MRQLGTRSIPGLRVGLPFRRTLGESKITGRGAKRRIVWGKGA